MSLKILSSNKFDFDSLIVEWQDWVKKKNFLNIRFINKDFRYGYKKPVEVLSICEPRV